VKDGFWNCSIFSIPKRQITLISSLWKELWIATAFLRWTVPPLFFFHSVFISHLFLPITRLFICVLFAPLFLYFVPFSFCISYRLYFLLSSSLYFFISSFLSFFVHFHRHLIPRFSFFFSISFSLFIYLYHSTSLSIAPACKTTTMCKFETA
jgi:hypothetical protein